MPAGRFNSHRIARRVFVPLADKTRALGEALDMRLPLQCDTDLAEQIAAQVACDFQAQGWRTDLHHCGIPAADAPTLLALALRNFNANHDRQLDRHREEMLAAIRKTIAPSETQEVLSRTSCRIH